MSTDESDVRNGPVTKLGPNMGAWLGPIVVVFGSISYFLIFVRFPTLRDFPWVNLPLVIVGVVLSIMGLRKAFGPDGKLISNSSRLWDFFFQIALGSLFVAYIFHLSYQMPSKEGVVDVSDAAPTFSVQDQNGKTVKLTDFAGKKLVVSFYRGFW